MAAAAAAAAVVASESAPSFRTFSNFRPFVSSASGKSLAFRSARQDKISLEETKDFFEFGIRTIVDLRSPLEYQKTPGAKLLDAVYEKFEVVVPKGIGHFDEEVELRPIDAGADSSSRDPSSPKRVFINVTSSHFIRCILTRTMNVFLVFFLLILDLLTGFRYRFLRRRLLRHLTEKGLGRFYYYTMQYSGATVCAALKILAQPRHAPVLVNCFYGKDRTGVVAALVLHILGRSRAEIRADFLASERALDATREADRKDMGEYEVVLPECIHHAAVEDIDDALDFLVERHGSVEEYLDWIGFGENWRRRMRKTLGEEEEGEGEE